MSNKHLAHDLKQMQSLPYVMRDVDCWGCDRKDFLIDYASYCNQPGMFKKLTFEQFLLKRHKNQNRIKNSLKTYKEIAEKEK